MPPEITEPEWKTFRKVQALALERFCEQILGEVRQVIDQPGQARHDRYLSLWKLMKQRDAQMAEAFNNPRRSQAFFQLGLLRELNLVSDEDMDTFSPPFAAAVERWLELRRE